jgi:hypothetical protein
MISLIELLNEETAGIDNFLQRTVEQYPQTKEFISKIKSFIENSNCKKIEISKFKYPAFGLALHNGVLFNETIFQKPLSSFLFIVFHEIAHQYQYKKYGDDKMYEFYLGKISVEEAAKVMKQIEMVADEFATRKVKEFTNLGLIPKNAIPTMSANYKNFPLSYFEKFINQTRMSMKSKGITSFDDIANLFYDMTKIKTTN